MLKMMLIRRLQSLIRIPLLLALVFSLASTCDGSQCEELYNASMLSLADGKFFEATVHLQSSFETDVDDSCLERNLSILAALQVAELQTLKILVIQAQKALSNNLLPNATRAKWNGILNTSAIELDNKVKRYAETFDRIYRLDNRLISWNLPTERLIGSMQETMDFYEKPFEDLLSGSWNNEFTMPTFRYDYTFVSFMSNCNEYWDHKTKKLDVAGIINDFGITLLFIEDYEGARESFSRILEITENEHSSKWRSYAIYGLEEVKSREGTER